MRGALVELQAEFAPAGPFRLPRRTGMDGMLRRRGGALERLLHDGEVPVRVRVWQPSPGAVRLAALSETRAGAEYGVARMRFALGLDDDLRPFLRAFARDGLIGPSLRRRPWLRAPRRPQPFEALAFAICEQLIEYERAAAIQRRLLARLGRRWPHGGDGALLDLPETEVLARTSPALLQSLDLGGSRARALVQVAREVAAGRVVLDATSEAEEERSWRRLRAIPGIGPWTVEVLALTGQGRHDQVPAGDLGLRKLAGRLLSDGDPKAVAGEGDVRELFAPYGPWAGLAAAHVM